MIDALVNLINHFPGHKNRVRCFAHIVNLVVKIILRQFDSRVGGKAASEAKTDAEIALANLAKSLDDLETKVDDGEGDAEDSAQMEEDDATVGIEELEEALKDAIDKVAVEARPVKMTLTKVSDSITYILTAGILTLLMIISYARLRSQSRIHLRLSVRNGLLLSRSSRRPQTERRRVLQQGQCLVMSQRAGIQPTICSSLHILTEQQLIC